MAEKKAVIIMSELWRIKEGTEEEFPGLIGADGYTDSSIRSIVIEATITHDTDPVAKANLEEYKKQVIRHEIIHAFLYESGLEGNTNKSKNWSQNEEMVDWIAIQFPKILKVFKSLNVL